MSEHPSIVLAGVGVSDAAPRDLEDRFPGRWDPRRSMRDEVRPLVHAVLLAVEQAGWRGTGEPGTAGTGAVDAGLVTATDWHPFEAAVAFDRTLREGSDDQRSTAFLSGLPSTATAIVGLALGFDSYQATLTMGEASGFQAVAHACDQLRLGRMRRMVVAALSSVGAHSFELTGAASGPLERAVAWCLEADSGAVGPGAEGAVRIVDYGGTAEVSTGLCALTLMGALEVLEGQREATIELTDGCPGESSWIRLARR